MLISKCWRFIFMVWKKLHLDFYKLMGYYKNTLQRYNVKVKTKKENQKMKKIIINAETLMAVHTHTHTHTQVGLEAI